MPEYNYSRQQVRYQNAYATKSLSHGRKNTMLLSTYLGRGLFRDTWCMTTSSSID